MDDYSTQLKLFENLSAELTQNGISNFSKFCRFMHHHFCSNNGKLSDKVSHNFKQQLSYYFEHVNEKTNFCKIFCETIGFTKNQNPDILDKLLDVALYIIETTQQHNHIDLSLELEIAYYEIYVKAFENEKAFSNFTIKIQNIREINYPHHNQISCHYTPRKDIPEKVGFFVHAASTLAHVNFMMSNLKAFVKAGDNNIKPVLFILSGENSSLRIQCEEIGIEIVKLQVESTQNSFVEARSKLEAMAITYNLKAMVWLCYFPLMSYFLYPRIAPKQIWWSLKFHEFKAQYIDGYICRYPFPESISFLDHNWKGSFASYDDLSDIYSEKFISMQKAKFNGQKVIATLARTELINNKEFLDTICNILSQREDTVYLWTGREEHSQIKEFFRKRNVLNKTIFIGWVDTKLYAHLIDIFADTFGQGAGITAVEAMAASKPVLFLDDENHFKNSSIIKSCLKEEVIFSDVEEESLGSIFAHSPFDYETKLNSLLDSDKLRAESGHICKKISHIWSNPDFAHSISKRSFLSLL